MDGLLPAELLVLLLEQVPLRQPDRQLIRDHGAALVELILAQPQGREPLGLPGPRVPHDALDLANVGKVAACLGLFLDLDPLGLAAPEVALLAQRTGIRRLIPHLVRRKAEDGEEIRPGTALRRCHRVPAPWVSSRAMVVNVSVRLDTLVKKAFSEQEAIWSRNCRSA